jgi:hypothetical protein
MALIMPAQSNACDRPMARVVRFIVVFSPCEDKRRFLRGLDGGNMTIRWHVGEPSTMQPKRHNRCVEHCGLLTVNRSRG